MTRKEILNTFEVLEKELQKHNDTSDTKERNRTSKIKAIAQQIHLCRQDYDAATKPEPLSNVYPVDVYGHEKITGKKPYT